METDSHAPNNRQFINTARSALAWRVNQGVLVLWHAFITVAGCTRSYISGVPELLGWGERMTAGGYDMRARARGKARRRQTHLRIGDSDSPPNVPARVHTLLASVYEAHFKSP